MNVAQRATSATGLGTATGYNVCDRWVVGGSSTDGRLTLSQDSSAPSGFANSLKFDCTTADTSIASGEGLNIQHRFEGQNLQAFAKGTSDAKPFALSFYVKGNASATYVAELYDNDNTRQISKTFNVTTDWTRVELTYPADTTGAFDDDNALSLSIIFWLHAGSTYTGGTYTANTWTGSVSAANRAVGISSFFSSTSNTFFLTGMQVEVGQNATEFEHEPIERTLAKCQRYYQAGTFKDSFKYGKDTGSGYCQAWSSPQIKCNFRASPTGAISGNSTLGTLTDGKYLTFQTWTANSGNTFVGLNYTYTADAEL